MSRDDQGVPTPCCGAHVDADAVLAAGECPECGTNLSVMFELANGASDAEVEAAVERRERGLR